MSIAIVAIASFTAEGNGTSLAVNLHARAVSLQFVCTEKL